MASGFPTARLRIVGRVTCPPGPTGSGVGGELRSIDARPRRNSEGEQHPGDRGMHAGLVAKEPESHTQDEIGHQTTHAKNVQPNQQEQDETGDS